MQDASSKEQFDAKIQALEGHASTEIVAIEVEVAKREDACRGVEARAAGDRSHLDSALRQEVMALKALMNERLQTPPFVYQHTIK